MYRVNDLAIGEIGGRLFKGMADLFKRFAKAFAAMPGYQYDLFIGQQKFEMAEV